MSDVKLTRRTIIIVDRAFQLRYVVLFAALGAAGAVATAAMLWFGGALSLDALSAGVITVSAITGAVLLGGSALVLTYRVAGPVLVMSRALEQLANGQPPELRPLREGDELADLHRLLGAALDALRADGLTRRAQLSRLAAALESRDPQRLSAAAELLRELKELGPSAHPSAQLGSRPSS